jgi:MYXO-CTERM domain-containing protein
MALRSSTGPIVAFAILVPGLAHASNGVRPRTPVVWEDVPCMIVHDRSQDPMLHIPYGIPFEDTDVTADEVPDSRTHQFFAMCRSRHAQEFLPVWITQADVDEAVAYELLQAGTVDVQDILETNDIWAGCWSRLNADDARLPITQANADAGIDWDTSELAPGGYSLYGSTHEPVFNVWWPRAGVVKIHDGDPDAVGPVGAISTGELTPYRDQTVMVEGCVEALPGTTFAVSYALSDTSPAWTEYSTGLEIDGAAFVFEFTPPKLLHGEAGILRVDFTDPMDRTYTAFHMDHILVIDSDQAGDCDDTGSFIGTPCDESGGPDESSSGGSGSETAAVADTSTGVTSSESTGPAAADGAGPAPAGCGCRADAPSVPVAALTWIGLLAVRARRRRD